MSWRVPCESCGRVLPCTLVDGNIVCARCSVKPLPIPDEARHPRWMLDGWTP